MKMQSAAEDKKSTMVKPEDALKGRSDVMDIAEKHFVLKTPMMLASQNVLQFFCV